MQLSQKLYRIKKILKSIISRLTQIENKKNNNKNSFCDRNNRAQEEAFWENNNSLFFPNLAVLGLGR